MFIGVIRARPAGNGFEDDKRMVISPILFDRELAAEHTPAYHQIMRMKFADFTAILRFLFWCFFARSLIDILRCFLAR